MKKYLSLLILYILNFSFLSNYSQCTTSVSTVSDVTLQCSGGTASRSAVAFYPTYNKYYSIDAGSASNSIETFSNTGGSNLSTTLQAANYNGFWYNFNLGILEGNVPNQNAILQHSINVVSGFPLGTTSLQATASMPGTQSCGQFDAVANQVLYYNAGVIYKYNRNSGLLTSSITVTGLPASSINNNSIIYTGIAGREVGVYDYTNRKIYFINYTTGVYAATCQLPLSAPIPTSYGVSYSNNRLFLFDNANLKWYGYRISNKPDLYLYGYNILCKFQEGMISVGNNDFDISTYTWSPATLFGNNSSVVIISPTPSATVVYSVGVTSLSGCENTTNFILTVYPNLISSLPAITGSNSVPCTSLTTITLTALGFPTYTWSTGAQGNTVAVTPTATTVYMACGTNTAGCVSSWRMYTVTVYGGPTITVVSSPTFVCAGQSATLTANGANTYTWMNGMNTNSIVVSPTVSTAYTLTGESTNGCKQDALVGIFADQIPQLTTSGAGVICKGNYAYISVNGPASYTWSTGEFAPLIVVQPSVTTTYSVLAENSSGCKNTAALTVTVSECLGIVNQQQEISQLTIYPNPNEGKFKITFNSISEIASIEIYNANGKSIYQEKITDPEKEMDLTAFPEGLYLLVCTEKSGQKITKKIIRK